MLRIYMFDARMILVDAAALGVICNTGIFDELRLQPPDTIAFRFFADTTWRVVLISEPEFALPFFSDPRGIGRRFKFSRRFRVKGNLQSASAVND
jgi:hypothetical protein